VGRTMFSFVVFFLKTLSDYIASNDRMTANSGLERIWEWSFFKILPQHLPAETGKPRNASVSIVGVPAETRTGRLPHTSQRRYRLSELAR
jgi:hypothetical protein